jgi:hypothetical protein
VHQDRHNGGFFEAVVWIAIGVVCAITVARLGLAEKWQVAFCAVVVPFWTIVVSLRPRWSRVSLWVSIALYLALQLLVVWYIFGIILAKTAHVAFLLVVPFAILEIPILFIAVDVLERRIRRTLSHRIAR